MLTASGQAVRSPVKDIRTTGRVAQGVRLVRLETNDKLIGICKIIENEDPRKPLSDSKIVSILQKEGLMLARRTIAKYREELKIPTSNQRKVLF